MPEAPGKRALLIGIDRYPNWPAQNQLKGCVNDAEAMARLLQERFGFAEEHVSVLRNEAASQQGIRDAVEQLIGQVQDGDIVVLHYSGHGSQRSSKDVTEGDGLDETIVPFDSGRRPHPNLEITDKEVHGWVGRLTEKTTNLTLIFDCCHSGTITRDAFGEAGRSVEADDRPFDELGVPPGDASAREASIEERGPSRWLPLGDRYVLMAGCQDEELSNELRLPGSDPPVFHGALTYCLSQELSGVVPGATYRDVFERASVNVSAQFSRQHPQMEGRVRDREVFGTRDIEPMRFVSLLQRTDGMVSLAAGAAHGLVAGSEWDVYPQGTKQIEGAAPLGRVRVEVVRAIASEASVLRESATGTMVPGARAVEVVHAFGDLRLRVEVQGPADRSDAVAHLAEAIEASPLLRAAGPSAPAEVRVYLVPGRQTVANGDPVPQLGPTVQPTWAAVGQDGRLVMPPHELDELGAGGVVLDNLETIARYRRTLALANPNPGSVLRGKVDLVLMRLGADGTTWEDVVPDEGGGQVGFDEGDRIAFRVVNGHAQPIFITVLDFGLSGRIAQLHPPAGASDPVDAGAQVTIGTKPEDPMPLGFPIGFPFGPRPDESEPVSGVETLKLFASTGQRVNFDALLQSGVRGDEAEEPASALEGLLDMALRGQGTRDIQRLPTAPPPEEEWITVDRPFLLRRTGD